MRRRAPLVGLGRKENTGLKIPNSNSHLPQRSVVCLTPGCWASVTLLLLQTPQDSFPLITVRDEGQNWSHVPEEEADPYFCPLLLFFSPDPSTLSRTSALSQHFDYNIMFSPLGFKRWAPGHPARLLIALCQTGSTFIWTKFKRSLLESRRLGVSVP